MTTIKIEMDGLNDVIAKLQQVGLASEDIIEEVLFDVATETQSLAVAGIMSGGGGKTYEKYKPRRTHTASAPGQYPASDTGRLASSVRMDVVGPTAYVVGTNVEYGPMLEFGTSRMAARPWLLPSFERARSGVERELRLKLEAKT
jgi:phage gpG-like protein